MAKVWVTLTLVLDTEDEPGDAVGQLSEALGSFQVAARTSIEVGTIEVDDWETL